MGRGKVGKLASQCYHWLQIFPRENLTAGAVEAGERGTAVTNTGLPQLTRVP